MRNCLESLGINLKNKVFIFDEAHNLIDAISAPQGSSESDKILKSYEQHIISNRETFNKTFLQNQL